MTTTGLLGAGDSYFGNIEFAMVPGVEFDVVASDTFSVLDQLGKAFDLGLSTSLAGTDSASTGLTIGVIAATQGIRTTGLLGTVKSRAGNFAYGEVPVTNYAADAFVPLDSVALGAERAVFTTTDSFSATDQALRTSEYGRAPADTSSIADSASTSRTIALTTASDAFDPLDSVAIGAERGVTTSADTFSVTDQATPTSEYGRPLADSSTITDSASHVGAFVLSISDALVISDQVTPGTERPVLAADTFAVSDSLTWGLELGVILDGTLTLGDSLVSASATAPTFTDSLSATELLTVGAERYVSAGADPLDLTDQIDLTVLLGVVATDSATISEQFSTESVTQWIVSDAITLSESITVPVQASVIFSDTLAVSDSVSASRILEVLASDATSVSEQVSATGGTKILSLADTSTVTEALSPIARDRLVLISDGLALTDTLSRLFSASVSNSTTIAFSDVLVPVAQAAGFQALSTDLSISVSFSSDVSVASVRTLDNYRLVPVSLGAIPIAISKIEPSVREILVGANAEVVDAFTVRLPGVTVDSTFLNRYLFLSGSMNTVDYARIVGVSAPDRLMLDQRLVTTDPESGSLAYRYTSGISSLILTVNEPSSNHAYLFTAFLQNTSGAPLPPLSTTFIAHSTSPQILDVESLPDGQFIVTFSENMRNEPDLVDPASYVVTGSTPVTTLAVRPIGPDQVVVETIGMTSGSYTLTVDVAP